MSGTTLVWIVIIIGVIVAGYYVLKKGPKQQGLKRFTEPLKQRPERPETDTDTKLNLIISMGKKTLELLTAHPASPWLDNGEGEEEDDDGEDIPIMKAVSSRKKGKPEKTRYVKFSCSVCGKVIEGPAPQRKGVIKIHLNREYKAGKRREEAAKESELEYYTQEDE